MINLLKDSVKLTNKYIVLGTPLILFSLLSSLYLLFSANGTNISLIIAIFLFFLMLGAFLSGWFYIVKECVENREIDPNDLIKDFPSGVGEYFLPCIGLLFNVLIISSIIFLAAYFIGMKTIGDIGFIAQNFNMTTNSAESFKEMLSSLNNEQLIKLNAWNILLFGTMSITYFVMMFYSPALFFKSKNPFISFFISLRDLFNRKFLKNAGLFLIIFVIYIMLSVLTALLGSNIVMHFVFTLANFYFLVLAAVYVYNYYYNNYVKVGGNIDTRV